MRRLRGAPVIGALLRLVDGVWWTRAVSRTGLVDVEYYRAQRGWRAGGALRATWDYTGRGFHLGLSPHPLFDELFAGRSLPEITRVPAMYAYAVSDKATVQVHPWWDAVAFGATLSADVAARGPLEALMAGGGDAVVHLRAAGGSVDLAFDALRARALAAATEWRLGSVTPRAEVTPQRVVVVRPIRRRDRRGDVKLQVLADLAEAEGVRPLAVFIEPLACQWVSADLFSLLTPSVSVELRTADTETADVVCEAMTRMNGEILLTADPRAALSAEELSTLARAASMQTVAIPMTRSADGTVDGLGAVDVGAPRPWPILKDHPVEDLDVLPGEVIVPRASGRTLALSIARYRECGGLHAMTDGTDPYVHLAARLASSGMSCTVLRAIRPVLDPPDEVTPRRRRRALALDGALPPSVATLIRSIGFEVREWRVDADGVPSPTLAWMRPRDGALRWAIKICAPAGPPGEVWGDRHFAVGLANALRRLGQTVVIDSFDARDRPTSYLDDVSIVVRGPYRIEPPTTGVRMEWIISHPDQITQGEVDAFDCVFAVSPRWARTASERFGIPIEPLLEATDADLFHPRGLARGDDIVFVGTARGIARPSVVTPIRAGIPVRVYGPDWRPFIPAASVVAETIPNVDLSERYETASLVLNDHWPAMRREGFMAMRPFDVVAAGGRVVSERVDGIEELFGGALVAYDTEDELVEILRRDPAEIFVADEELALIGERIRAEESFDARAAVLLEAAVEARQSFRHGTGAQVE